MMELFLLITAIYGIWLFFAYAILLPNYRYSKRVQIFELRDQLRELKYSKSISNASFNIMEHAISNGINTLSFINLIDVFKISQSIENNIDAKEKIEKRITEVETQKSRELLEIKKKVSYLIAKTSIMNMIGWLPVFIVLLILFRVVRGFATKINIMSNKVALDPKTQRAEDCWHASLA